MALSAEQLSEFVASPTPREIPPEVRAARLPTAPLAVAWAVALLCTVGTWPLVGAVFPHRLLDDLRLDLGSPAVAAGTVTSVEPTGRSLLQKDGEVDVERPIQRIRFRFDAAGGATVAAECFAATRAPEPGAEVGVEYLAGYPEVARIPGATCSATPRIGAFVVLMPAIATAWLLRVLAQRRRVRRLLAEGRFATARIAAVREHPATFGPGRIEAALDLPGGDRLDVDFDLARREGALLRARAATTREVGVLRDPDRPQRLMLTDTLLPGGGVLPPAAERDAADDDDDDADDDR